MPILYVSLPLYTKSIVVPNDKTKDDVLTQADRISTPVAIAREIQAVTEINSFRGTFSKNIPLVRSMYRFDLGLELCVRERADLKMGSICEWW